MNRRTSIVALALVSASLQAACTGGEGLHVPADAGANGTGGARAGTGGTEAGTGGLALVGVGGRFGTGGAKGGTGGSMTPIGVGGQPGTGGAKGGAGGALDGGFICGPICDIYCRWGNVIDARGCPTCACNAPPPCDAKECPPPPPYAQPFCDGGMAIPPQCLRGDSGACGWTMPTCQACPTLVCPPIDCPLGNKLDGSGCPTCECVAACATRGDYATCTADSKCTWLAPGCGTPALASPGCYAPADVDCTGDADCSGGRACLKRVVNPCSAPGGTVCNACGVTRTICL